MRRVLINMQSNLFASAINSAIRTSSLDYDTMITEKPSELKEALGWFNPHLLIFEISDDKAYSVEDRQKIVKAAKQLNSQVKVIFIVNENKSKELTEAVKKCKKDGLIDQFVFGSVSSSYLLALVDTLV